MLKNNLKTDLPKMQTLNFDLSLNNIMDDENLPAQCHPVSKPKKKKLDEIKNDTV
jgi:hypothetical protein